jgi:hypothetical protein
MEAPAPDIHFEKLKKKNSCQNTNQEAGWRREKVAKHSRYVTVAYFECYFGIE